MIDYSYHMQLTLDFFEQGLLPDDYVQNLKNYRSLVKDLRAEAEASPELVDRLKTAAAGYAGPVRATMATEDWCGDAALNLPILDDLFAKADVPFRIFRGSEHENFRAFYNDRGLEHIPRVSLWDGNGNEIGVFVERPQAIGPKVDGWKDQRPQFYDLYKRKDQDKETAKAWVSIYMELLNTSAEWYKNGMWEETQREIVEIVEGTSRT